MKFLVVGLGNPGEEYSGTRHNIGFSILDNFALCFNVSFKTCRYGEIAELKYKGRKLYLLKPSTFMNLSGKAVNYWINELKLKLENTLIVNDDISIPFGVLRMRKKGSDGGHNGLKDINNVLQTQQYPRLRFGIGNNYSIGKQSEFVLGRFNDDEKQALEERVNMAIKMIQSFTTIGINFTMTQCNGK